MRELLLWAAKLMLLAFMALYFTVVWTVNTFAGFLSKQLDAVELNLQLAQAERRTRNGRKRK